MAVALDIFDIPAIYEGFWISNKLRYPQLGGLSATSVQPEPYTFHLVAERAMYSAMVTLKF